jgi:hypothetical protein
MGQQTAAHEAVLELIAREKERRRRCTAAGSWMQSGTGVSALPPSAAQMETCKRGSEGGDAVVVSREALTLYMRTHNPAKSGAAQIDLIFRVYQGRHAHLIFDLRKKYKAAPPPIEPYAEWAMQQAAAAGHASAGQAATYQAATDQAATGAPLS